VDGAIERSDKAALHAGVTDSREDRDGHLARLRLRDEHQVEAVPL
jgi:hypothetical protein